MSGFTAINVEREDNIEEDIDDTREIQLEEAFKLYQTALKLHSQGSEYYQEAQEAYDELLKSEVFKYPEVVSDFAHDELDEEPTIAAPLAQSEALATLPSNAAESSASSIPQLLYLSFKNRGQFLLDLARHRMANASSSRAEACRHIEPLAKDSVRDLSRALERDDADLELWQKAARVADVLGSHRLSRFCLESVVAGDDDDMQRIDISGLEEVYAAGELEDLVDSIQDDASRLKRPAARPKSTLLKRLRETNDPFPWLPKRSKTFEYVDDKHRPLSLNLSHKTLKPTTNDLKAVGHELLKALDEIQEYGPSNFTAASTVSIVLPETTVDSVLASRTGESQVANEEYSNINGAGAKQPEAPVQTSILNSEQPNGGRMDMELDGDTIEVRTAPPVLDDNNQAESKKRSAAVAGNDEPEGRTKSKRLRTRESAANLAALDEDIVQEDTQHYADQLRYYEQADQATFDALNALFLTNDSRFYLSIEQAKAAFWSQNGGTAATPPSIHDPSFRLSTDFRKALLQWSDDKSDALLKGHGSQDSLSTNGLPQLRRQAKPSSPKRASASGDLEQTLLKSFTASINAEATIAYEAAAKWLLALFTSPNDNNEPQASPYLQQVWSADMRHLIVFVFCHIEDYLWQQLEQQLTALSTSLPRTEKSQQELHAAFEFAETVLEVLLDATVSATQNKSIFAECAQRWASLANTLIHMYLGDPSVKTSDPLTLRFLWASFTQVIKDDDVDKAHAMILLEELKYVLEVTHAEAILLPNNPTMPEISAQAIQQQLSSLSTSDFFSRVFDDDLGDPVALIEMLEPILESVATSEAMVQVEDNSAISGDSTKAQELINHLNASSAAFKLKLWRRLQNAYTKISYTPKVVSCLFRIIETIVAELQAPRHLELDEVSRQTELLKWLQSADEAMNRFLTRYATEPDALDFIDAAHLKSTLGAVTKILKIVYGFVLYEDSVRVGQTIGPQLKGARSMTQFEKCKDRLRDILVRVAYLQYILLKEGTVQEPTAFPRAADHLAEHLCTFHHSLGIRQYCKHAGKIFVKLVKSELSILETTQDYAGDMAQAFFDLYQLRFASGTGDYDHGCPPENLDKNTAWSLIPTIMKHAERFNIKDLSRSELKGTIEKMQAALGTVKNSPHLNYNKRNITAYLKSVVTAKDLLNSVKGRSELPATGPSKADTQVAAEARWYFLLGLLTLSKYKSIKRVNPTPIDDLLTAREYFRSDLDHDISNWESWYRLAQVYEALIEDDLMWNSAKLNESRGDIATLERQAIHCYIMATTLAARSAELDTETLAKMEDMRMEFGTRLYASSRPPFDMQAFRTDKNTRYKSFQVGQENVMSTEPYHKAIEECALWNLAARLLATQWTERPKRWMAHYTRAKCLWKMFQIQDPERSQQVTIDQVLHAVTQSIKALPKKEKKDEPILEPHLKLVSIVHKLVRKRSLTYEQARVYMQASRYATTDKLPRDDGDEPDWDRYMLDVLAKLSNADKAKWHHRITHRAAHVLYDELPDLGSALGAKHQFMQQIFTKDMSIKVWKPEHERPGRHYVYTGQYVVFMIHLLEQLNDRPNLDQLIRRTRRKPTDFIDHTKIWEEAAMTYVRMLRKHGRIPLGHEKTVFDGMSPEEFTARTEKMENWTQDPETSSIFKDIMQTGIELKRLNNSLLKTSAFEDLVGDAYTCLYEEYLRHFSPLGQAGPLPTSLPQGNFINVTTEGAGPSNGAMDQPMVDGPSTSQLDGASDNPVSILIPNVGLGLQGPTAPLPDTNSTPAPEAPKERAKPGRAKTVTRRDIQKKAESALAKPPPIKTPILSKRVTVEIPLRREESSSKGDNDKTAEDSRRSSAQNSEDGDADVEDAGSELSELDEMDDGGADVGDDEEMQDGEDELEIQDSQVD